MTMARRGFFKAMLGTAVAGPSAAKEIANEVSKSLYGGPSSPGAAIGGMNHLWKHQQEEMPQEQIPNLEEKKHYFEQLKKYKRILGGTIDYEDIRYMYQNNHIDQTNVEALKSCSEAGKRAISVQRAAEEAKQSLSMDAAGYIEKIEKHIMKWWPFG